MIVNQSNFPRFTNNNIEILSENRLFDIIGKTSFLTDNYFFCSLILNYGNNVNLIDYFSDASIQTALKDSYLLITSEFEPTTEIIDIIYDQLIKTKLVSADKVIILSENKDIQLHIKKISDTLQLPIIEKIYWICNNELAIGLHLRKNIENLSTIKFGEGANKIFLNLNRRWRPHRPLLVALLKHYKLLDHGLVSLAKADDDGSWDKVYDTILELCRPDQELFDIIKNDEASIKSIPYMSLDTQDFLGDLSPLVPKNCNLSDITKIYTDTLVSVVTETLFFENCGRFISEKTFKCFAYKHPFILLNSENTLPLLVNKGYKTFHPYIDETYDTIVNPLMRLKAVVREIKRITEFTDEERIEFVKNLTPIVEHNFNVISEKRLKDIISE